MKTPRGAFTLLFVTALAAASTWWAWESGAHTQTLSIAVAGFEHDDEGRYADLLAESVEALPNVRVVRIPPLSRSSLHASDDAQPPDHESARDRLRQAGAETLIWGSVLRRGDVDRVRLNWTVTPDLAVARDFGRYEPADDVSLPPLLWEDLYPVLRLLVATYAVDVRGQQVQSAADTFFPFVVPVYDTLAQPAEGAWSASAAARIAQVLAHALFRYAEQTEQAQLLEDAVATYRDVLATHARWRDPMTWAKAESHLGAALAALGERRSDQARLEDAVNAFRAALWEQTPDHSPVDWVRTQVNLGNALTALGARRELAASLSHLEAAVAAYRAALTEETRERMPLVWAAAQHNLGNVLKALAELNTDTTRMEEAVAAYHAALTVETRRRMPLQWATVQSNLASALARVGEAESDPVRLKAAIKAYRAALQERRRDHMPLAWAATQNNLGNALRTLGQIESDTRPLEQAADAYTAALAEFTRAKSEPQIETTKRNLERTLKTLNARKQS
jgi:tetratricopeptide (TPR) repeat protein